MVIKWTTSAKQDLKDFIKNARIYNPTQYVTSLMDYAENLAISNQLGKFLFSINELEIRQLIYKKHRIIYYVEVDEVVILSVVHTARNLTKYIEFLKENM